MAASNASVSTEIDGTDVPNLDLVLPCSAAGLDASAYDIASQAWAITPHGLAYSGVTSIRGYQLA